MTTPPRSAGTELGILCADRSERGKLALTGPQRAWFLHQVVTQAFEDITPGEARDAAMITAHGRMTGYCEALATEDAVLCHFESELIGVFEETLRRYVFATQVDIADVTSARGLVLVAGSGWREIGGIVAPEASQHRTTSLGVEAGYLWLEGTGVQDVMAALEDSGAKVAGEADLEHIRISNGVARWGREMNTKAFPQEVGIEGNAIHYDKGCYLGQEAMAKIHFRGKVNRKLVRVVADAPLSVGAEVSEEGQKVGSVTSASNGIGLALVRHTVAPGAEVSAGGVPARIEAPAPYS
ncbi:MAG: folate-binding protein YgfZ [Actinobacteria bacterium]|nr:folate-binding protein YgfZ [Actinomycetota bacterium]